MSSETITTTQPTVVPDETILSTLPAAVVETDSQATIPKEPNSDGDHAAPSDSTDSGINEHHSNGTSTKFPEPLKLDGILDQFKSFDVTPVIGREFPEAQLTDWMTAENSDKLLRDLAITISQRGVVFFRKQDGLTNDLMKSLILRLGELTGKPATSRLHVHPVNNGKRDGRTDDEISVINYSGHKSIYADKFVTEKQQSLRNQWHSDITFEPVPASYTMLRLQTLPKTGGDTLWASGYELYDRISAPYQKFLETLTATYAQPEFIRVAKEKGFKLFEGPRGAPENVGTELSSIHPVVRTHQVTGWKSIFAVGFHVQQINGLSQKESKHLLDEFITMIMENHDIQVRHRWQNPNDLAIWDNRCVYHAATFDYEGLGDRFGSRAVGLGERPFFNPDSKSRWEDLASEASQAEPKEQQAENKVAA